jgi:hypothetical protein
VTILDPTRTRTPIPQVRPLASRDTDYATAILKVDSIWLILKGHELSRKNFGKYSDFKYNLLHYILLSYYYIIFKLNILLIPIKLVFTVEESIRNCVSFCKNNHDEKIYVKNLKQSALITRECAGRQQQFNYIKTDNLGKIAAIIQSCFCYTV